MLAIKVEITRFVDDHQPGFVECLLIDAHGKEHLFIEKVPVVTLSDLNESSSYPAEGVIGCEVLKGSLDTDIDIITVSTEQPWGIESTEGLLVFDLRSGQLIEVD
ncbi:MAG: hypothetical protein ABI646_10625 [Acidobacteriota bacterium]